MNAPEETKILWGKLLRRPRATDALDLSLDLRLFLLASERATRGGHAHFAPGELRTRLQRLDKSTGVVRAYGERGLRDGVARLRGAGLLAPDSTLRCLWLPMDVWDMDLKKAARWPCGWHGHCNHYTSVHEQNGGTGMGDRYNPDALAG